MKVPKYIDDALKRRERAAYTLIHNDLIISEFIKRNNINCEYTDLHCATLGEPAVVTTETINAILAKECEKE